MVVKQSRVSISQLFSHAQGRGFETRICEMFFRYLKVMSRAFARNFLCRATSIFVGRKHGSPNHWNGQRMTLQQGVSHTPLEWTDGNAWAGSFPYFEERNFPWSPLLWKIALLSKMDRWMSLQQGVSHTPMEWTDGKTWAGSFSFFNASQVV